MLSAEPSQHAWGLAPFAELTVEDAELVVHQRHPQYPGTDVREGQRQPDARTSPESREEQERWDEEERLTRDTQHERLPPEAYALEELRGRHLEAHEGEAIEAEA